MSPEFIDQLRSLAKKPVGSIDNLNFNCFDMYGSNIDDAYFGGFSHGERSMARDVLAELEKSPGGVDLPKQVIINNERDSRETKT